MSDRNRFHQNAYGDFNRGDYMRADGGGLTSTQQSFRGRGPKNWRRADERIREDVCERLERDHYIDASDIEVTVADGVVTLAGTVDERRVKRYAEDLVEEVPGVADVQNQLRVRR